MKGDGKIGLLIGLGPKMGKSEGGEGSPARLAAKGALQAIKDDDAEAFEDAVRTLIDACGSESGEE